MTPSFKAEGKEICKLLVQIMPENILMIHPKDSRYHFLFHLKEEQSEETKNMLKSLHGYDLILLPSCIESLPKEQSLTLIDLLLSYASKGVVIRIPGKKTTDSMIGLADFRYYRLYYERIAEGKEEKVLAWIRPRAKREVYPYERIHPSILKQDAKLRISYLLPHKGLTGGVKMLLEQMRHLREKGHIIRVLIKGSEKDNRAIPDWYDLEVDEEVIVPEKDCFLPYIHDTDIIFSGWITQLLELEQSSIPVVYWEQGYQYLFGDVEDFSDMKSCLNLFTECYHTKHAIVSVSEFVADQIRLRYGRETMVLSNGIDTAFYTPGKKNKGNKILLVGNKEQPFKNFALAFRVLELIFHMGIPFEAEWVTPYETETKQFPFPITIKVRPSQKELVKTYQEADILLFTSLYEGFGMPPLEAMACGTAVVCTDCGGISTYVRHKYNAYIVKNEDAVRMAGYVIFLLQNPEVRSKMQNNGRNTALSLDYSKTICKLEEYLHEIARKGE